MDVGLGAGEGGLHAIQTAGDLLVAGRYGEPAIDVSRDGGKTFESRRPPAALVDLEVDPDDPRRWVATTQTGIFTSTDQGASWRAREPTPNTRLSWPAGVLRVLGTFSSSTVVSTFERPFEPGGPQVLVIGSPVPMAAWLEEAVAG